MTNHTDILKQAATTLGDRGRRYGSVDNYVDGINYLAFASQFSTSEEQAKVALEEDIAAMARKFAPRRPDSETPQQPPQE